jgi:hypothetical protein
MTLNDDVEAPERQRSGDYAPVVGPEVQQNRSGPVISESYHGLG